MKYGMNILYFMFLLTVFTPLSYAANDDALSSSTNQGISKTDINKMIEDGLKNKLPIRGDEGDSAAPPKDVSDDDKDKNKVFRYRTKKGAFSDSELPQRTFKNIAYPY